MATGEIDTEDAAVAAIFGLSAATQVGIADVSMFGFNLSDTLTSVSGTSISYAVVLSLASLAWVWFTNEPDLDRIQNQYGDEYYYASMATFAAPVAMAVLPSLSSTVTSNDVLALGAVAVQAVGFTALSYFG